MKLATLPERHFESSKDFEQHDFVIGDETFIIDILRSKMYSNAVKTLTQEIMTNARDAHQEAGKNTVPIEVKLPNTLEPFFGVRDFGPGITPDRMKNIFVKYGVSSKRDTNDQVGGYGLGAKSPWAYTDTFNIITFTPEKRDNIDRMIRREYISYIDNTRKGKLVLVSEEETNEPQGTYILVPCKQKDFQSFEQWTRWAVNYWDVRPVIKGSPDFSWNDIKYFMKETNWGIEEQDGNSSSSIEDNALAIIDGIPYHINTNSIFNSDWWNNANETLKKDHAMFVRLLDSSLRLFFKTGEVYLTANREEIDYKNDIIEKIILKMVDIVAKFRVKFQDDISKCKNLWDAGLTYKRLRKKFKYVPSLTWNNIDVEKEMMFERYYNDRPYDSEIVYYNRNDYNDTYSRRYRRTVSRLLTYMDTADDKANDLYLLCVEEKEDKPKKDDNGYHRRRGRNKHIPMGKLETLFDTYPKVETVFVLMPSSQEELQILKDKYNLDLYPPVYLSGIKGKKKPRDGSSPSRTLPSEIKCFDTGLNEWDEANDDQTLEDGEGYYVSLYRKDATLKNGKPINSSMLHYLSKELFKVPIYGIPQRFIDKLGEGWQSLDELISEYVSKIERGSEFILYKKNAENIHCSFFKAFSFKLLGYEGKGKFDAQKLLTLVNNRNSLAHRYISFSMVLDKLSKNYKNLNELENLIDFKAVVPVAKDGKAFTGTIKNINTMKNKFMKQYPFIMVIDHYPDFIMKPDDLVKHMAGYIKMVDKKFPKN